MEDGDADDAGVRVRINYFDPAAVDANADAVAAVAADEEDVHYNNPDGDRATFEPRPDRRRDDRGRAIGGENWSLVPCCDEALFLGACGRNADNDHGLTLRRGHQCIIMVVVG
mmetsp:Transcript_8876/g.18777  ORF Transcript_8876/g.18777 Transcript_8876/m.18777 type:complete len:113 (-) Transcript_8876:8-346(-)